MERPIGQEAAEAEVVAEAAEEEENQPVPILLICLAQSHRLLEDASGQQKPWASSSAARMMVA